MQLYLLLTRLLTHREDDGGTAVGALAKPEQQGQSFKSAITVGTYHNALIVII
jgi:hypothetical protein